MASLTYNTVPTSGADEESQSLLTAKTSKPRLRLGAAVVIAFAVGATVAYVAPSKSSASTELASSQDCVRSGSTTSCSPLGVAKAWKSFDRGAYANDCVNAMAMAFGEGIVPGVPLALIDQPSGPALEEFLVDTDLFDLNQAPISDDDNQPTLGPWQVMTDEDDERASSVSDINDRIREAIGYVQSCCMGDVDVLLPPWLGDVPNYWCKWNDGNCENEVNGECRNPYESDDALSPAPGTFPVTTILKSNLRPALTFCGCATTPRPDPSKQTVGFSGRCSRGAGDYYTKYTAISTAVCNRA